MACRRSGVRIPLAPPIFRMLFKKSAKLLALGLWPDLREHSTSRCRAACRRPGSRPERAPFLPGDVPPRLPAAVICSVVDAWPGVAGGSRVVVAEVPMEVEAELARLRAE